MICEDAGFPGSVEVVFYEVSYVYHFGQLDAEQVAYLFVDVVCFLYLMKIGCDGVDSMKVFFQFFQFEFEELSGAV